MPTQTETLVTQAISWSRMLISSQLISWLALDWCSQTEDVARFFLCSLSLFSRARSCLSYVVLSTAVACNVARPFSSQGKSFLLDVLTGTLYVINMVYVINKYKKILKIHI